MKVKEPQLPECAQLSKGQVLFTYLHLAADKEQAIKRGDDFKSRSEKLKEELDGRTEELTYRPTLHA